VVGPLAATLEVLHLGELWSGDVDMSSLSSLRCLRELGLSGAVELPEELQQLPKLTRLYLNESWLDVGDLTCHFPQHLWRLKQLRSLEVAGYWEVGHALPDCFSALTGLKVLDLRATELYQLPQELGTWMPGLEEVRVADGYTVSSLPSTLTCLKSLAAGVDSSSACATCSS
jgi:hypothetical protein